MTAHDPGSEAERLEQLWTDQFGNDYTDRNLTSGETRGSFWSDFLSRYRVSRILEVGCNVGGNLRWFAERIDPHDVYGVDINDKALGILKSNLPAVNGLWSTARQLPFRDGWFDLVFTMGVLIHQPDLSLPLVMSEIVRCSRRYVLCGEYCADTPTQVPYRGETGALIKRDFGHLYQDLFPNLTLLEKSFLGRDQGWDDVTIWLFDKASPQ